MNYFESNFQRQPTVESVKRIVEPSTAINRLEIDTPAFVLAAALAITFLISAKLDKKTSLNQKALADKKPEETLNRLYKKAIGHLPKEGRDSLTTQLSGCRDVNEKIVILKRSLITFDNNRNERDNSERKNRASKFYGDRID